jgi:hypothetical protein
MNFYASRGFLETAAAVYFKGRSATIENVRFSDAVLRLLVLDGRKIVTRLQFLDYHQPLGKDEIAGPIREGRYAENVCRGVTEADAWDGESPSGMALVPFIDWSRFSGFEDFRQGLLDRHRGLMRDRERRGRALAARYGALSFSMDDRASDVLAAARAWKGRQLREIGYPDLFENPQTMDFFERLRERGLLVSSTLRAGGRLVSLWLGFVHEGVWSGWIFTYDPDLRKYSPGHQLLIRMMKEGCRLRHREFDFSGCAQDYMMIYATHGRVVGSIGRPSPARATVLYARDMLRAHSPSLFAASLRMKCLFASAGRGMAVGPMVSPKQELKWIVRPRSTAPSRRT